MKNYILLSIAFLFSTLIMNAQFQDDFEDCGIDGTPINGGHWTVWGCGGGAGCAILCSTAQAHSGTHSGLIPDDGSTNAVLDLGGKIFGEWSLSFWQYVPSNQEAYWNLQGVVPIRAGEWIVGNIFFNQDNANPSVGLIDDPVSTSNDLSSKTSSVNTSFLITVPVLLSFTVFDSAAKISFFLI